MIRHTYQVRTQESSFGEEYFSVEGIKVSSLDGCHIEDILIVVSNLSNSEQLKVGMSTMIPTDFETARQMLNLYQQVLNRAEQELSKLTGDTK